MRDLSAYRCVWILGASGAGKSTLASAEAQRLGWPVVEAGAYARAECGPSADIPVDALTAHAVACLGKDHRHYSRKIQGDIRRALGSAGHCIVVGVRNPVDFLDSFSPKEDAVIFLAGDPATAWERDGLESIRLALRVMNVPVRVRGELPARGGWRLRLDATPPAVVDPSFLGLPPGDVVAGRLLAVEAYAGDALTLTWLSDSGHIYCYLPPHAFGFGERALSECVDINCPDERPSLSVLPIEGPGWCRIGRTEAPWDQYLATVDWPDANVLVHVVVTVDGAVLTPRVSRFQIGGDRWDPPRWKKSRSTWSV